MLRCALVLVAVESAASLMLPVASVRSVATAPRFSPLTMQGAAHQLPVLSVRIAF